MNTILFSHETRVRIDDINFGNHLCHTKFINIIHNARANYLKSIKMTEADCFGFGLIVLNLNISYLSQCFFDDHLTTALSLDGLEKASFSFIYEIYNHTSNKIAAKAISTLAFMDLNKNKLQRIPNEFIKLVNQPSRM